jgi:hypothetical protein
MILNAALRSCGSRQCDFILIRRAALNTISTLALATFAQPTFANQSE